MQEDASVKAVVLRVDSPGGSAFASDEIWRAIEKLKQEGKPVVVSMGGTAASGGYYVSSNATAIYANPSTVTGSIGVYSGKFSLSQLYENLGITVEQYTRGRTAAMYSMSTAMDPHEFGAMDRLVEEVYRQFKSKVEMGRSMTPEEVETVAQGRVWSGRAALNQGLVDNIGGFYDAVARAKEEAGLGTRSSVELITYRNVGSEGSVIRTTIQTLIFPQVAVPPALASLEDWAALSEEPVWAMLPYHLEIH